MTLEIARASLTFCIVSCNHDVQHSLVGEFNFTNKDWAQLRDRLKARSTEKIEISLNTTMQLQLSGPICRCKQLPLPQVSFGFENFKFMELCCVDVHIQDLSSWCSYKAFPVGLSSWSEHSVVYDLTKSDWPKLAVVRDRCALKLA
jgi:hypothetical protein